MTLTLKIVFVFISILTFLFVILKIRKSQLQIADAIMWIVGALFLILISICSDLVMDAAHLLGFYSASNFILTVFVFFLLLIAFSQSIKISVLNDKVKNLNHYIALDKKKSDREDQIHETEI